MCTTAARCLLGEHIRIRRKRLSILQRELGQRTADGGVLGRRASRLRGIRRRAALLDADPEPWRARGREGGAIRTRLNNGLTASSAHLACWGKPIFEPALVTSHHLDNRLSKLDSIVGSAACCSYNVRRKIITERHFFKLDCHDLYIVRSAVDLIHNVRRDAIQCVLVKLHGGLPALIWFLRHLNEQSSRRIRSYTRANRYIVRLYQITFSLSAGQWCAEYPRQPGFFGMLIRWTPVQGLVAPAAGRAA